MANPRQRRKARSSSHRPISHSRHAKRNMKKVSSVRGPKALQEAWDKHKTVHQNYTKLGLTLNLNPLAHGGFERSTDADIQKPLSLAMNTERCVPTGFGRILRDDGGTIIGFEASKAEEERPNMEVTEVEGLEVDSDQGVDQRWVGNFSSSCTTGESKGVLQELEEMCVTGTGSRTLSMPISGIGSRYMSSGEVGYLGRLVKRYGNDVEGMSEDLKLNPEQRTVGELRRALRKMEK